MSVVSLVLQCHAGGRGAPTAAIPHPVWSDHSPDVSGYVELLQFLCGEELARLRVWVEPLRYADASRVAVAVSDVLGQDHLKYPPWLLLGHCLLPVLFACCS